MLAWRETQVDTLLTTTTKITDSTFNSDTDFPQGLQKEPSEVMSNKSDEPKPHVSLQLCDIDVTENLS